MCQTTQDDAGHVFWPMTCLGLDRSGVAEAYPAEVLQRASAHDKQSAGRYKQHAGGAEQSDSREYGR